MPLYREDLEQPPTPCAASACREPRMQEDMWFHARCHLGSPTWARYRGDVLTIQCAACERDILSLVIASKQDEP